MSSREFADAKKCALTTQDWDSYQVIIRKCLSPTQPQKETKPEPGFLVARKQQKTDSQHPQTR